MMTYFTIDIMPCCISWLRFVYIPTDALRFTVYIIGTGHAMSH